MKKLLILLGLLPGLAGAATLNINWTNPTVDETGAPLTASTAVTSLQVFISSSSIADGSNIAPTATLTTVVTTTTQTVTAAAGSTLYVRLKACNQWGCSGFSNQATRVVPGADPGVPTNVTITITVT